MLERQLVVRLLVLHIAVPAVFRVGQGVCEGGHMRPEPLSAPLLSGGMADRVFGVQEKEWLVWAVTPFRKLQPGCRRGWPGG